MIVNMMVDVVGKNELISFPLLFKICSFLTHLNTAAIETDTLQPFTRFNLWIVALSSFKDWKAIMVIRS